MIAVTPKFNNLEDVKEPAEGFAPSMLKATALQAASLNYSDTLAV